MGQLPTGKHPVDLILKHEPCNSVQETYVQGPNPPSYGGFKLNIDQQYYEDTLYQPFAPGISASCMGCHFVANVPGSTAKSDFSFMLGEAK